MSQKWKIYSAGTEDLVPSHVVKDMIDGVTTSWYAAYRLTLRDIRSTYTKSAFGMTWDLIDPLILGSIFYFLRQSQVIEVGDLPIPYGLFVIFGLLMYSTFSESLLGSVDLLRQSKGLLSQLKLPPEALIMSIVYRMIFYSLFRITVMLGFSIISGYFSLIGFLSFLALYSSLILAGVSIGLFLSTFHAIYNDVGRVARITLTPFRYVTPILWPIESVGVLYWLNLFNPIAPLINDLRLLATSGVMHEPVGFVVRLGIYGVLFLLSCYIFRIAIPVLVDRA